MALPEGSQALLPEDALHSLQDAVVLGCGVSGGKLLNLELEEIGKNIFSFTFQHWFKCPVQEFTTLSAIPQNHIQI